MRQTALQFKPKPSTNDENMRPLDDKAKRKRLNEDAKSPSKTAPAAGSSGRALHTQPQGEAPAGCVWDVMLGAWKPIKRVPVDSSDDDDWAGTPFEVPKKAAKKAAQAPDERKDSANVDGWAGFGPPPPRATPTGSPAARPVQPSPPPRPPAVRSPAKSKASSSGKVRKSAKKLPPSRPATPPALPPITAISGVLEGEAASALVSSWQFVRCFAHVLQLEGCLPPSLEQLEQGLRSQGEVGAVTQLHVCLLKLILSSEDNSLLDYESNEEEEEPTPAEIPSPDAPPADAPPADATAVKRKRGRPPGSGAHPAAAARQPARRAQHVPRPNTGLHAWNAGDLKAYVDEDTWPEVLRQLIVQWHLRVDDKDGGARPDQAEPDAALLDLAERLREGEYSAVPPPLRAAALGQLCDWALELLSPHIVSACDQLEAVRKAESSQDRAAKKAEREARNGVKAALTAARNASTEAWSAYSLAEKELDRASQEYHKSAITQEGVAGAKMAMQEAQRARDEAREASKEAKDAIRRLQAGGAATSKGESEVDERKPTERLLSMQEAKAQAEARAAAAEAAARAAKVAAEREQWKEMVRLRPLGRDADGALYWQLPRPQPPDDLEYCQPQSAPVLLVETSNGRWGRVASARTLRRSLAARSLPAEARLRDRLSEVGADDQDADQEAGLLTPGGTKAHEWVGMRVRRVVQGEAFGAVVSGWRPARGDGRPAEWHLLYDDGDEEVVDEEDVRDSLEEAAEPELRALRRKMVELEAALLGGPKKSGKAGKKAKVSDESDAARAAWAAGVDRATTVDEMRPLLEELYESTRRQGAAAGGADELGDGASRDGEWAEAWQREVETDWHKRARASSTSAQLSLRADEAEWNLHTQGDLAAGTQLEVRSDGGKDGSGWRTAHVVAVFGDGSFRVVWEESGGRYKTKDLAAALSKAGQKEQGTLWRFRPATRAPRSQPRAAAGGRRQKEARPQRSCTRQTRAALAEASADGESEEEGSEDEEGESAGSAMEGDSSAASEDERAVDVGDVIEAVHGASGSKRRWLSARVSRTMRGGAFKASFVERQFRNEEKLKLNEEGRNKLWRWPGTKE